METFAKTLESQTRIQYHDCDPFNHLNNSRYIDYLMGTRTEQLLNHYGFNTAELAQQQNIGWVTALTQISYFYPASWMEIVTIETRLIQYSEGSVLFEAIMWDENKSKLKAVMWSKLVHFDIKEQRSKKHSEELMQLFQQVIHPLEQINSFEDRLKSFKK